MTERPRGDDAADRADARRDDLLVLQDRLQAALHEELTAGHVDERNLNTGTRDHLRRHVHRRRRTRTLVGAATLAALVAIPVGLQWLPGQNVRTVPVGPATANPTQIPVDTPTRTPVPSTSAASQETTEALLLPSPGSAAAAAAAAAARVDYEVPELPSLTAALPQDQELHQDLGQYAKTLTVAGQGCPGTREGVGPQQVAGRWWTYTKPGTRRITPPGVDVVVTGWATGTGQEAFRHLVDNTGACRFGAAYGSSQRLYDLSVPGAEQSWAARSEVMGTVWGASRVGDVIVAVTIDGMLADEAAPLLPPLLQAAVADLRDSGLPAVASR